MWVSTFETPRVEIRAYGRSEVEVAKVIRMLWKLTAYREGYDPNYISEYWDEVTFDEIHPGYGFTDGHPEGDLKARTVGIGPGFVPLSEVTDEQILSETEGRRRRP